VSVYHNTVIQNGTYKRPIEYRFASTTGVDIRNNLTDGRALFTDILDSCARVLAVDSARTDRWAKGHGLRRTSWPVLERAGEVGFARRFGGTQELAIARRSGERQVP
jgi:hypothetical protein